MWVSGEEGDERFDGSDGLSEEIIGVEKVVVVGDDTAW